MKLDKESLIKVVDDNETIEFLEKVFSNKPEYEFLDRLNKNIKKQSIDYQ